MATSLRAPEPFSFTSGNVAAEWKTWRKQFEWYLLATRKDEQDGEVLVGVLLTLLGVEGLRVYETFVFATPDDAKKVKPVLDKFDSHFEPRKSEVFERFKFLRRHQKTGESFDTWVVELRNIVKSCNYGVSVESVLRDQIVLGVADQQIREKLLFESNLDLAKACDIVRACEASKAHLVQMGAQADVKVHEVTGGTRKASFQTESKPHKSRSSGVELTHQNCHGCGRRHKKGQCIAANIKCHDCGQIGHFARRCPQSLGSQQHGGRRDTKTTLIAKQPGTQMQLHSVEGAGDNGEENSWPLDEEYVVYSLCSAGDSEWFETLSLDGVRVRLKLDSGASCNVLPKDLFVKLPPSRRRLRPGPRLKRYGARDGYLKVLGVHSCKVVWRGAIFVLDFVVVDEPGQPPILGLPSCKELNLIRRVDSIATTPGPGVPSIVNEFSDIFTGLGKLPVEHDIRLATGPNSVDPVVCAASRLPFKLEEPVFRKLDEMVADGIITPVSQPTEWVSRMVVVGKPNGDVRICIDPSELNKAIQRQHYAVPTVEQLFAKVGKARWFCSLDAASGFYQIPLSAAASFLCTMATPRGRFRYLRLPFGLKSAPEVYLQVMSDLFGDLPGVIIYFDDFLVTGESVEELQLNLRRVFERCRTHNLRLQLKKCRFFQQELPWLGHVIGQGVLKADPEKVEAIVSMPDPTNKADLIRIMGMVTYLDKFCKNLAALTRPLRDLLKEDSAWVWEEPQKSAMMKLKEAISSLPVLRLFDVSQPVTLSVDASPYGIGAVLLQDGQPVAYSSTSLTSTQKRYCQIEKELLAVQFGLLRFRQYVYGQRVVVEADHKPLIGLVDKPIATCTPRIQRMRLQLQRFDFQLVYKPGKELFIADTLSRAPSPREFLDDVTQDSEEQVHSLLNRIIPEESTRCRFAAATADDPTLQLITQLLLRGWPEKRSHCPQQAKPFWQVRHDLSLADGLVIKGERIVVPSSLQREVMEGVHDGHFGEVKCILRARSSVYWPGCDDQIRNMVASCVVCQTNRHRNPKPPQFPVKIPTHAFQMVSADLFEHKGVHHLLVVDSYSKWPCVMPLKSLTASSPIKEMERFFCDFGVPEELETDNGPQFDSAEFRAFCAKLKIRHITSSPEYPQSNGLVERHLQTVKKSMLKMLGDGRTLWETLAAIRSTPVLDVLPSPAVLLQGRNLRGSLPFMPSALTPKFVHHETVRRQLLQRQAKSAFNQTRCPDLRLSALMIGQRVRAHVNKKWLSGVVESVCLEPLSYIIRLDDGRRFRRTRRAINLDKTHRHAGSAAENGSNGPIPPPVVMLPLVGQPSRPTTAMEASATRPDVPVFQPANHEIQPDNQEFPPNNQEFQPANHELQPTRITTPVRPHHTNLNTPRPVLVTPPHLATPNLARSQSTPQPVPPVGSRSQVQPQPGRGGVGQTRSGKTYNSRLNNPSALT